MKKVLSGSKYLFLFLFCFVLCCFTYSIITSDAIWNFGFSYAIARGEVPYVDFNMVVPPFSPFVYLIPFLFSHSYITYLLFHSILFVVLFYFLEKLFGNKVYLLLIFLLLPFPVGNVMISLPGYNFLLLLLFVIILYCEKNNKSDYFIGILLGLCIFTKQSVGVCLCLPSLYYLFKNRKRFFKRFLGIFTVCCFFLVYFLIAGNLLEFLNHCLFGLIDFSNKNGGRIFTNNYFWLWLLLVLILFYFLVKKNHKLLTGYLLCFSIVSIPIFDHYHTYLFMFVFLLLVISKISLNNKWLTPWCLTFSFFFYVFSLGIVTNFQIPYISSFHNFEIMKINRSGKKEIQDFNNSLKKFDKDDIIFLMGKAYFFKIMNEMDITYYDLLNYGNHGYHGTERILNQFKKEKGKIVILDRLEYQNIEETNQLNMDVINYVLENYQLIDKIGSYEFYQRVS